MPVRLHLNDAYSPQDLSQRPTGVLAFQVSSYTIVPNSQEPIIAQFSKMTEKFPIADESKSSRSWQTRQFVPHPLLANPHLMTVVPGFLPRPFSTFRAAGLQRWFTLNDENKLLGYCHWQPEPEKALGTVLVIHGLEGSSESSHVLGIGHKSFAHGFNVVRLNMRNCGGSMMHARSLYNAGMWEDMRAVMRTLHKENGCKEFILAGYSLGGNLILNTAAHHTDNEDYEIKAVCTVSPSIDLAHAVDEIELPHNRLYQNWFLRTMKAMLQKKSQQHPDLYDPSPLKSISTIRQFDDVFTAPNGGYGTAARYYKEASAINRLQHIKVPIFMLAAEDDPLVPIDTFHQLKSSNPEINLLITKHGGHGGFLQSGKESGFPFDEFWAENRVVDFILEVSSY